MKEFVIYLRKYFRQVNLFAFLLVSLLVAVLIFINYTTGIENNIMAVSNWPLRTIGFFFLYTFTFCAAFFLQCIFSSDELFVSKSFFVLLMAAPAIFALKVTFNWLALLITQNMSAPWAQYS